MSTQALKTRAKHLPPAGLLLALVLLGAGCSDSPVAPGPAQQLRVVLDQEVVQVESLGDTVYIGARVMDQDAREVSGVTLEWTTDAPHVLSATPDGTLISQGNGTATIQVRISQMHPSVKPAGYSAGISVAHAQVQVQQVPRSLSLHHTDAMDHILGRTEELLLWALDQSSTLVPRPVDARGRIVEGHALAGLEWSTVDQSVATVDSGGRIRAAGDGVTLVRVTGAGLPGEATVRVQASLSVQTCAHDAGSLGSQGDPQGLRCASLQFTFYQRETGS